MIIKEELNPQRDAYQRASEYVSNCETKGDGCRNEYLNKLAYALLERFDIGQAELFALCLGWASQCDPPYPVAQGRATISSAWIGVQRKGTALCKAEQGGGASAASTRVRPSDESPSHGVSPPPPKYASQQVVERLEEIIAGTYYAVGLPWAGIGNLTQALLPGTVTMLCAPPGSCKSLMMLELVVHLIRKKETTAILEMEEDRTFHLMRILAMVAGNSNLLNLGWIPKNKQEVRALGAKYQDMVDAVGNCVYEPPQPATGAALSQWVGDMVKKKVRVLVIDPITAKERGKGQVWAEDEACLRSMSKSLKGSNTSLILVTHPNGETDERAIAKDPMADFSGGKCWQRFTQTALFVRPIPPKKVKIKNTMGVLEHEINRKVELRKVRNSRGEGLHIGLWFDHDTLRSKEFGVIQRGE